MITIETQSIPSVGATAPDFTLPSTSGSPVTLTVLRGKPVLLAFFPLAFTGTCTAELCAMRDDFLAFESRNVVLLPISVDSTDTLRQYKAAHEMKVDLLSDFHRDVSARYGVLNEQKFYANRSYFLLDAKGTIRWEHVETSNGQRRPNDELFAQIDQLTPR